MESYRQSFRNKGDVMVLQPNSDFFRYMKSPKGGGK
jgi:membrane protease subunit HflC